MVRNFVAILVDLILPVTILYVFSSPEALGPSTALIVALLFPLSRLIWILVSSQRVSVTPVVGLIAVLATGFITLLKLPPPWLAVKEASIPMVLGVGIAVSAARKRGAMEWLLSSRVDVDKIVVDAGKNGKESMILSRFRRANYALSAVFLLSAILNFVLAKYIVTAEPGTELFNRQLATMSVYSVFIISVPTVVGACAAAAYAILGIRSAAGRSPAEYVR